MTYETGAQTFAYGSQLPSILDRWWLDLGEDALLLLLLEDACHTQLFLQRV